MAVADQDSGCGGRHVIARNESNPVLGQPGQHTMVQRRLRLLHKSFGIVVHTQDGPDRRRGDKMLLAPPVRGAERRLLLLPRARGRYEDDMLTPALTAASMAATFCAPRFPCSRSTVEMMSRRSRLA
jgi:hypothetical protein